MRASTLLSSLAAFAAFTSAQSQDPPPHDNYQRQRRWVWGPSIIQDPTSGQDTATLPPIGSNVNQFTSEFDAVLKGGGCADGLGLGYSASADYHYA